MWKEELLAEGWMQELTESSAGSLESEEDFGLSEAGDGWTLLGCRSCGGGQQPPGVSAGCGVALLPSGGGKCSSHRVYSVSIHRRFTWVTHISC